jgi:hypothetical protein
VTAADPQAQRNFSLGGLGPLDAGRRADIRLTTPMASLALPDPPLSDGVITLRGFESSDVRSLVEICRDPEIARWTLVPSPYAADAARGRGAASRAVALLAGWAFGPLRLDRVELRIDKHNLASLAVAARTGFDRVPEPLLPRPETARFVDDIFFARMSPGAR